jgi:murein DD-endopeptidase MepM/ murein hydrolase activator NlpD
MISGWDGRARALKRAIPGLIPGIVLVATLVIAPAVADAGTTEAERAAQEIQAMRDRANAAAQALFDAESELDTLDLEIAANEARVAELEAEVGGMRASLGDLALRRFTAGGVSSNPLFTPVSQVNDAATAGVLTGVATGSVIADTDQFEATLEELADARSQLERNRADAENKTVEYAQLKQFAEDEVVRLQELEEQRLTAEAEAELARMRQERVAAERAAAEEAARQLAEQQVEQQQLATAQQQAQPQQVAQPQAQATEGNDTGGAAPAAAPPADDRDDDNDEQPAPAPQPAPLPEPLPSPTAGNGMVCPVAGPTAFADTWGAPRSGGRTHQGVDMMSPGGTPLVAVESGSVTFKQTPLGGNSVWLNGASGARYFYAHLSGFEGSSRGVSQGDVIGYVGATGNTSVNHLHFEVHPNGPAVNPYPYVAAVC